MKSRYLILPAGIFLFFLVFSCSKRIIPIPSSSDSTVVNTDTVNLSKGLLVYLPFNGSIADSSGNGNLTYAMDGGGLGYDEHGNANSAFVGNGTGGRVLVINNGSIKLDTAFSLSYDFMILNMSRQVFVSYVDTLDGSSVTFASGTSQINLPNFFFGENDSTTGCGTAALVNPRSSSDTSTVIPQPESWYNAICIFHNGTIRIYINGNMVGTNTAAGTSALLCPGAQMVVGGWWNGDAASINGKLDNVRLYNRVLDSAEIATLSENYH